MSLIILNVIKIKGINIDHLIQYQSNCQPECTYNKIEVEIHSEAYELYLTPI